MSLLELTGPFGTIGQPEKLHMSMFPFYYVRRVIRGFTPKDSADPFASGKILQQMGFTLRPEYVKRDVQKGSVMMALKMALEKGWVTPLSYQELMIAFHGISFVPDMWGRLGPEKHPYKRLSFSVKPTELDSMMAIMDIDKNRTIEFFDQCGLPHPHNLILQLGEMTHRPDSPINITGAQLVDVLVASHLHGTLSTDQVGGIWRAASADEFWTNEPQFMDFGNILGLACQQKGVELDRFIDASGFLPAVSSDQTTQ